jgi:alpha-L-fucosidase
MTLQPVPLPTAAQLNFQEWEFGMFCHFGINTFYAKEWSDGTLDPRGFAPTHLDARQWVQAARDAGMRYLVFTAKHHDGFCLWQTDTTDYSVRSSPWKEGKGDVVAEVAEACREVGLPLGVYLSPWDRHEPCYADPEAYDRFYIRQLTELCTRYGELAYLWFDGAGSEGRRYDWETIMAVADRYQPGAMVFNMGRPTVRWIGNEDGVATDPCHYAVETLAVSAFTEHKEAVPTRTYMVPECDVAIRRNWFWQPDDRETLKSTEHLLGIWYRSIGRGANLLLNVPPNRAGLLDAPDVSRLQEMTTALQQRFASPITATLRPLSPEIWEADFGTAVRFEHLMMREVLEQGQRIESYTLETEDGTVFAQGGTIGHRKVDVFPALTALRIHIRLTQSSPGAALREAHAYDTGYSQLPALGGKLNYDDWAQKADKKTPTL